MITITVPKESYKQLVLKARAFEKLAAKANRQDVFDIEPYTGKRIKEFQAADKLSPQLVKRIKTMIKLKQKS